MLAIRPDRIEAYLTLAEGACVLSGVEFPEDPGSVIMLAVTTHAFVDMGSKAASGFSASINPEDVTLVVEKTNDGPDWKVPS